jgi:crotonobetainyl-CoA:carnitine CoA-transferase CaiB-like acyl-CoA transferase
VALDQPGGPELVKRLAADCDIFVTNLVQERRVRYGLTEPDVRAVNDRIVYVSFSGYGTRGPDADRPGFDFAAYWAATGIMGLLAEPDAPPPLCRGGQGDHATATNLLAATLAALRLRDVTGEGQHVETTLQASGMWAIASDYSAALVSRVHPPRLSRKTPVNPIWNSYRCADGKWVLLVMPVAFPSYWPKFATMVGRDDWLRDYADLASLRASTAPLTAEIEAIFARHDRAYWSAKMDEFGLIWAPVAELTEVIDNEQVREMGWITEVEHPEHGRFETLDTPFKIYGTDIGVRGPAPEAGQHTFEVLSEFGISEDELSRLATDGVIG